jgi:hypothetical protein
MVDICVAKTVRVVEGSFGKAVVLASVPAAELMSRGAETPVERRMGEEIVLELSISPLEVRFAETADVLVATGMTEDELENRAVEVEVEIDSLARSAK